MSREVPARRKLCDGILKQRLAFYWDGADRLREIKQGIHGAPPTILFTTSYDEEGLWVSKWDAWTGQHDDTRGPSAILHDSHGNSRFMPGLSQRSSTSDRFFHADWLGGTRWMSEATDGNSFPIYVLFDSFGNRHAEVTTPGCWSEFGWSGVPV